MKKILLGILCVLVCTLTVFNIKSREFFVKVDYVSEANHVLEETETVDDVAEKTVRIIIMNNNYTTIYHSKVNLTSSNMTVYYGENYKNKKSCKNLSIEKDHKMFKKNQIIKVESKNGIVMEKDYLESGQISYKGIFYIYNTSGGLVVVNEPDIEDYVAAVVSCEIGEDSPEEALKAQAVCARTFIINSHPEEYKEYDANGDDSTSYQVYNKIEAGEKCIEATEDTKGQIMTYNGKIIKAYYFSTSCGYTTDYRIWGKKKQKYLKGCCILDSGLKENIEDENTFKKFIQKTPKSYESECPFYRWNVYLTNEQIQNALYTTTGINVGEIEKIEVNARGSGGIASQITVYGDRRQLIISNQNQIRKSLCSYYGKINLNDGSVRTKMDMLPSAFIYIENANTSGETAGFRIYGGGFGHGSGLSQNGAIEMAKRGITYKKILKTFYSGITIENY